MVIINRALEDLSAAFPWGTLDTKVPKRYGTTKVTECSVLYQLEANILVPMLLSVSPQSIAANKRIRIFSKQILTLALLMVLLMAVIVIRASYLGGIARSSRISAAYDKGMA
jgi:hypothetical protein